ncbi:leucine-rich repeat-containing protein 20 isoform X2 [Engystomops pustulosus]|uniref:leucine-rich repeat-containing protein 20 isoform X2 n=1 Tax=Engystomops pustulosus TaxID=76066 RepID=UPI003AFAEBB1
MAAAADAAKVAKRVSDVVAEGGHHLDLSNCALNGFPLGLYLSIGAAAENIYSISLANNGMKSLTGKFFTFFTELQELNLEGNLLAKLPHEVSQSSKLRIINLSKNKFDTFPVELTEIQCIENINLEDNQIKGNPFNDIDADACLYVTK